MGVAMHSAHLVHQRLKDGVESFPGEELRLVIEEALGEALQDVAQEKAGLLLS